MSKVGFMSNSHKMTLGDLSGVREESSFWRQVIFSLKGTPSACQCSVECMAALLITSATSSLRASL